MSKKAPPSAMATSDRGQIQTNPASEDAPKELQGAGTRPIEAYEDRESEFPEKLSVGAEKKQRAGIAEKKKWDEEKNLQTPEKSAQSFPTGKEPKQAWI